MPHSLLFLSLILLCARARTLCDHACVRTCTPSHSYFCQRLLGFEEETPWLDALWIPRTLQCTLSRANRSDVRCRANTEWVGDDAHLRFVSVRDTAYCVTPVDVHWSAQPRGSDDNDGAFCVVEMGNANHILAHACTGFVFAFLLMFITALVAYGTDLVPN